MSRSHSAVSDFEVGQLFVLNCHYQLSLRNTGLRYIKKMLVAVKSKHGYVEFFSSLSTFVFSFDKYSLLRTFPLILSVLKCCFKKKTRMLNFAKYLSVSIGMINFFSDFVIN